MSDEKECGTCRFWDATFGRGRGGGGYCTFRFPGNSGTRTRTEHTDTCDLHAKEGSAK